MSLRRFVEAHPATVSEMERAAERRYYEGLELLIAGRTPGGVYLLGYVAECLLKCAYFRLRGVKSTELVKSLLAPARANAKQLFSAPLDHEGFHSIQFWATLLRAERRRRDRPLAKEMDARFVQRCRRLYLNWTVELRYSSVHPDETVARSVLDDASWLRQAYHQLWR